MSFIRHRRATSPNKFECRNVYSTNRIDVLYGRLCAEEYASQIAEKQETITSLNTEIASITVNIDTLKVDLKEKKAALKKAQKEVTSLEAKKAKADAKASEEAKKAEAEAVLKKLLASGMSADEILEKLK